MRFPQLSVEAKPNNLKRLVTPDTTRTKNPVLGCTATKSPSQLSHQLLRRNLFTAYVKQAEAAPNPFLLASSLVLAKTVSNFELTPH